MALMNPVYPIRDLLSSDERGNFRERNDLRFWGAGVTQHPDAGRTNVTDEIADWGLEIADCGLGIADLQTAFVLHGVSLPAAGG